MNTISLKVSDTLLARLEHEAQVRGMSKSHLVRESLEMAFATKVQADSRSCFDLAQDLAGSLRGLPKDLATNPVHMEGFGK